MIVESPISPILNNEEENSKVGINNEYLNDTYCSKQGFQVLETNEMIRSFTKWSFLHWDNIHLNNDQCVPIFPNDLRALVCQNSNSLHNKKKSHSKKLN